MKNLILALLLSIGGLTASAQDGLHVVINYRPEHIEILPDVFEFFGTIKGGPDDGHESYALSVNSELVESIIDSLGKGKPQILFGPKLEPLIQEKVLADYQKKRNEIEKSLRDSVANAPILSKEKSTLKRRLEDEQKNTVIYVAQLKKIVERDKLRCIYIYGHGGTRSALNESSKSEFQRKESSQQYQVPQGEIQQPNQ